MLLCLVCSINAYSQTYKFKLTHHYQEGSWARSIVFHSDTNFWIAAQTEFSGGPWGIMMLRYDLEGNLMTQKVFAKTDYVYQGFNSGSLLKGDSIYYLAGQADYPNPNDPMNGFAVPFLAKFDRNGDTIWIRHYNQELNLSRGYYIFSCTLTQDSGILIAGSRPGNNPAHRDFFLMKADTAGDLLWHKTYGVYGTDERGIFVRQLSDSRILFSGTRYQGADSNPWLIITDADGNNPVYKELNWSNALYASVDIKPAKTGGYYIIGTTDSVLLAGDYHLSYFIARLDDSMNLVWRSFFNSPYMTQVWDFKELDNGNIVFCGDRKDSIVNFSYGYIAQLDSNGSLRWWQTYHEYPMNHHYLSAIEAAPDGGFVAVGSAMDAATGTHQGAWILKTDSLGCALASCVTSVMPPPARTHEIQVYPNPVTDYLQIGNEGKKSLELELTDMTGAVLRLYEGSNPRYILDLRGLSPGLYCYRIRLKDGKLQTGRITKL